MENFILPTEEEIGDNITCIVWLHGEKLKRDACLTSLKKNILTKLKTTPIMHDIQKFIRV